MCGFTLMDRHTVDRTCALSHKILNLPLCFREFSHCLIIPRIHESALWRDLFLQQKEMGSGLRATDGWKVKQFWRMNKRLFCFWQFKDDNQNIQHHQSYPSLIFSFHSTNYRQMTLASCHPCHDDYVLVRLMARFSSPPWFTDSSPSVLCSPVLTFHILCFLSLFFSLHWLSHISLT